MSFEDKNLGECLYLRIERKIIIEKGYNSYKREYNFLKVKGRKRGYYLYLGFRKR